MNSDVFLTKLAFCTSLPTETLYLFWIAVSHSMNASCNDDFGGVVIMIRENVYERGKSIKKHKKIFDFCF